MSQAPRGPLQACTGMITALDTVRAHLLRPRAFFGNPCASVPHGKCIRLYLLHGRKGLSNRQILDAWLLGETQLGCLAATRTVAAAYVVLAPPNARYNHFPCTACPACAAQPGCPSRRALVLAAAAWLTCRPQAQGTLLASDMSAFKAANPGSCLEDFMRWHSARGESLGASVLEQERQGDRIAGSARSMEDAGPAAEEPGNAVVSL